MRPALILVSVLIPVLMLPAIVAADSSRMLPMKPMQEDNEPALMKSNYANVAIDGDPSEWSVDEFREFDVWSLSERERNTTIAFQVAINETHYFGHIEYEDDSLFSAFPFRTNETKVLDGFRFEFHDAARTTIHDGIAGLIVDESYEEEIFEAYDLSEGNDSIMADFGSIPNTTLAYSDVDFDEEGEFWERSMINTSNERINASYEDGHYSIWFVKEAAEFNNSNNPYGLKIEVEFARWSSYTDGTMSPFDEMASWCWGRNLVRRLDLINATGETVDSLDWNSFAPAYNDTIFPQTFAMRTNRELSMAFRNDRENIYVAVEIEFPYVNQTTQVFGENYVPLHMQCWVQINQTVPGEEHSTRRLYVTIFNDNVTDLFEGIQAIEEELSPYPNNVDQGLWIEGIDYIPQEFPFAYSADMTAQNKYFLEFSRDLRILDVEEWGNGTQGAEVEVSAFFWVTYFNPHQDWGWLVNETNEQRGQAGFRTGIWRIPGNLWVGQETVNPDPQDFGVATGLYPIRNVTISQDESQGIAVVQTRLLDEEPLTAELTYHLSGGIPETIQFLPSLEGGGFYYAEIPNLKSGDQVIYQISVKDRFNTTTMNEEDNFRFGSPPNDSDSIPANIEFAILSLTVFVIGRRALKRGDKTRA